MARVCILYFDLYTGYFPGFHHGIAYLCGALKRAGQPIRLHHLKDYDQLKEASSDIENSSYDIVCLSFTTNQKRYVKKFFDKTALSRELVIGGGVHVSLLKHEIFDEFPKFNGICIGEGELPLTLLCQKVDNKEDHTKTDSFYFKNGDKIIQNPVMVLQDIDKFALPDYTLFDYRNIIRSESGWFAMMLSRGCPFNCAYCCNHALKSNYLNKSKYVRFPSIERSIEIIKSNLSIFPEAQKITFLDDTFTLNKEWIASFCEKYKREIGLPFICNARVETINEDTVKCLADAGCQSVEFGVESGNELLRKEVLNRGHSNRQIKAAFETVKRHNMKCFSFNIVGFPYESVWMARETLELNREIKPDFGNCFFFFPYPRTRLYQLCKNKKLIDKEFENVSGYMETPVLTETFMKHKEMIKYNQLLKVFFCIRLVLSRYNLPDFLERGIVWVGFNFRMPLLLLLDPNSSNRLIKSARALVRNITLKYLR